MRISPVMRGARAYALATLVFSLGLSPSYARMGGSAGRPAFGGGHFSHFAPGGFNRFGGNQLFVGGWGWGGFPATASEPIIAGDSAPVIINIGVDPEAGDAAAAYSRGCVIHKLNYDNNGKYVGERQIPLC